MTYADHVVVVTVVGDREVPLGADELDRGEGMIGREVEARVDDVVWSRPDPDHPVPDEVTWESWGWLFEGDPSQRSPVVASGTSRVELGYSYVVAVAWEEARCADGDDRVAARWTPLGGAAIIPVTDGVLGVGEFEGRERSETEARAAYDPEDPNRTIGQELAGGDLQQLDLVLQEADPGRPEVFAAPAPCS